MVGGPVGGPTGGGPRRRLGVWSLGFLRQPALRRALASAGWDVVPGWARADAVGVWGRRPVSRRGLAAARLTGRPALTVEDGFLRSVRPGPAPVLSLLLDDLGVHYDPATPSRLQTLIAAGDGDPARARAGINLLRRLRLSKYNAAPRRADPPSGHVLVVDQTAGDAALMGAGRAAFRRMLGAAKTEHPDADIVIRAHPEVAAGHKSGHFTAADAGGRVRLDSAPANPWDLTERARAVYVVSSQLGFEALTAGRPVRCFGAPFYAGWGATEDEAPVPGRTERRSVEALFAAACLDYPVYFDPWRGGLSTFEDAVAALALFRDAHEANRRGAVCAGVRLWKRGHVARFLDGPGPPPAFNDDLDAAAARAEAEDRRLIVWASKTDDPPPGAARMEDGFLRSVGLGAALTPPLSLCLDDLGIYYDPTRPSRLERLIAEAPDDEASRARAARLRAALTSLGVTKYNLAGAPPPPPPKGARVILVPGQVEDDASIRLGAGAVRTNLDLLRAVRAAAPDAHILYKPHPDVEAGLRAGAVDAAEAGALADAVLTDVSAADALAVADEVWTITSLLGFEALLRGLPVVALGAPFYAGWGLTDDRGGTPPRRTARPTLNQLIHAVLIDYPGYRDPVSGLPCPPEVIVDRLAAGLGGATGGGRLLAKAQGAFATYAWVWRRGG